MKKNVPVLLIFGIAIVVSSLVLLLLVNRKDSLFWASLGFLEFSMVIAGAITVRMTADSKFAFPFGLSVVVFSGIYVLLVAVIDALFGWLLRVDLVVFLCIHMVAFTAFVVIGALLFLSGGAIAKQNEAAYICAYEQQVLLGEAERLRHLVQRLPLTAQREALAQISTLHESIRFSDLSPGISTGDIDNRIRSKVFSLACEIDNLIEIQSEDITAIHMAVSDIQQLLTERNLKIRNGKIGI